MSVNRQKNKRRTVEAVRRLRRSMAAAAGFAVAAAFFGRFSRCGKHFAAPVADGFLFADRAEDRGVEFLHKFFEFLSAFFAFVL